LPLYGDGRNVRGWLFVDDHCAGLLAVLERASVDGKYNIGGNDERTNLETVGEVCQALQEIIPAGHNPALIAWNSRPRIASRYIFRQASRTESVSPANSRKWNTSALTFTIRPTNCEQSGTTPSGVAWPVTTPLLSDKDRIAMTVAEQ
jgi:dTDP-D-glucose 4,6-dehydratase